MVTSKLTRKCQVTIPAEIRELLGVKAGDVIAFEAEDRKVVIRPVHPLDVEYAKAIAGTLGEWETREDEDAYRDL